MVDSRPVLGYVKCPACLQRFVNIIIPGLSGSDHIESVNHQHIDGRPVQPTEKMICDTCGYQWLGDKKLELVYF